MIGLNLADGLNAPDARDRCLAAGVVINCPAPGTLRMLPPLILSFEEADRGLEILGTCVSG